MKITNGSPGLAEKGHVSITPTEICFGLAPGSTTVAIIITIAIIIGIVAPGPFLIYLIIGFVVSYFIVNDGEEPDTRKRYKSHEIARVVVGGIDRVGHKTTGGSLGGAAVGGLLFGGVGAIVGAISGGNKMSEFNSVVVKFTDGEWVVLSGDNSTFTESTEYKWLLKLAGNSNECPI